MPSPDADTVIRIATALVVNPQGYVLLVRKAGAAAFMQAGGKIDTGETAEQTLRRELVEELSLPLPDGSPEYIGFFRAPAANEPGRYVEADCFFVATNQQFSPQAEIEEALWIDPFSPPTITLAPLTRDYILPLARERLGAGKATR
ncbi:NUDIX hydrolase [Acetobacter indonesiensis]|uniref:DNA mismatch repair protein MutT n=1 Tax=Acetobacter indonesiensis TaxID=104101 RepID=A0A252AEV9_9PROT|nr:NUDIX domain-containing protein [Acetobacter indonesiensis]OUI88119.1 DNA mismatch repair protein MutT [Acetobacter indonesiensis]